ncbi:hypothetical protein ACIOD0_29720 [Kitasatospora albolonga]
MQKGQLAHDYVNSWNENAKPFTWTATADEILAKVRLVQAGVKKIVNKTRSNEVRIARRQHLSTGAR